MAAVRTRPGDTAGRRTAKKPGTAGGTRARRAPVPAGGSAGPSRKKAGKRDAEPVDIFGFRRVKRLSRPRGVPLSELDLDGIHFERVPRKSGGGVSIAKLVRTP